jgi:import inner membrane translocase subunit TIM50
MNLDETLIKTMWDREHGYRCAKRPGLDRFLGLTSCLFETVIFTSQQMFNAEIIIKNIDPYSMYFLHHLFREHTRFHDGKIVKDLSHLNRDLGQIIIMDSNPDAYSLQPNNSIAVPAWDGNPDDTYLLDIIPFLETLFLTHPDDVREVLKEYQGKDVPKALAEKEQAALEKIASQSKGGLRSLLGGNTRLPTNPMEQRRRLLEANYENQRPLIMAEAQTRFKEYEEETKRLMDENKMTFMEMLTKMMDGSGPSQPPQPTPSQ